VVNDIDGHVISRKVESVGEIKRCSPLLSPLLLAAVCAWGAGSESAVGRVNDVGGGFWVFRNHPYIELGLASNSEMRNSVITDWLDKVAG
jgi:hypothetical protein